MRLECVTPELDILFVKFVCGLLNLIGIKHIKHIYNLDG